MKTLRALVAVLALAAGPAAHAQLFRAYLSTKGSDANPCTLPAPCRLLPAAINAVADKGEIWMLDSGNYNTGTVTLAKSVSVLAVPGVVGSLVSVANDSPAIDIAAGGLAVALRNLSFTALADASSPTMGVRMTGNSSLVVEDSAFFALGGFGIRATQGRVMVANTTFTNIPGYALHVMGTASALAEGSRFVGNGIAVKADGDGGPAATAFATLVDCVLSRNVVGLALQPDAGNAIALLDRSLVERSVNDEVISPAPAPNSTSRVMLRASTLVPNPLFTGLPGRAINATGPVISYSGNVIAGTITGNLLVGGLQ